jgi:PAS domain S-box-containing protein
MKPKYPPQLKAEAALAAIAGEQPLSVLAARYGVDPADIAQWQRQLIAGAEAVFGDKTSIAAVERSRAEAALRESEAKYRSLFDSIDEGFCILRLIFDEEQKPIDYRYLEINRAFEQQTGLTNALGKTVRELVPDIEEFWFEIYGKVALTGQPTRFVDHAESMGRWFDVYAFRIGASYERHVAVLFNDITERKRAEEELRYRGEQFQALLDQAPLGAYLIDADFRIAQVNPVALPVFGQIPDLIGRDFDDVVHILWPRALAEKIVGIFRHTLETGEPHHTPELAERRVDRGVTEYYDWRINRITLPDGRYGAVCYFSDISEQVRARRAIAESEERYRTLFESIDEGFCVFEMLYDPDGNPTDYRWLETNPAFERHTGLVDAVGRTARELVPGLEHHWLEIYGRVAETGEPERFVEESAAMDRWFEVGAFRVGKPQKRRVGLLFNDITARKRAEEALRAANAKLMKSDQQKDEFLAMLAHELRNPLAAIANVVRLLELTTSDEAHIQRSLEILRRQTGSLSTLVDDLLDVSRVTRGLIELRMERVDLAAVAARAVEGVQALVEEKQQALRMALPGTPLPVVGDPVRLEQIVVNLLTNATKYTDRGGRIILALQQRGGGAELRVRDTGVGLAPEMLGRVFDLFAQAERGHDRAQGGLGIGLTVVKRLTELHGGSIEAHSEGIGRGAEFVVKLPLASPEEEVQPPPPEARARRTKRILVVDDSADIAETLARLLELAGHEVAVAHDGPSALAKAEEIAPEVILLDIGMPGMDGYELARRLRQHRRTRGAALAALTGYGQPSDHERTKEAGFDAHFVKPVDIDALAGFLQSTEALLPRR